MSKSTSSFPLHLASDILLRLPPKSIAKSRCVSKLWSSITNDPYFTNSFETRSLARPSLLMFFRKKDKLLVFSFPQHNQNPNEPESSSSHHVDSYHMKYPQNCFFDFKESVHGLICFKTLTRPIIWNPSMKKLVTLPKPYKRRPNKRWEFVAVFLGYDPIEGKHKVVCMPCAETSAVCRVLTLGSAQESWRTIKTNQKHCPYFNCCQRCINGVIYYQATIDDHSNDSILVSFDVRTEKFDMINLPSDDFYGLLIPYKGKLACVNTLANDGITMWVLEDAEKHIWSRKHFLTTFARSLDKFYRIDGATDAGELICVPVTFLRSFFILYFDPERNSLRRVEFKGIANDGFRFGNGLGNKRLSRLYTFSNHIDTLMSL